MKKDLPNVYPVPVDKKINNDQTVYYSNEERMPKHDDNLSLESKINRIFNSSSYIYKKDVIIKTRNGNFNKTLVGRTEDSLLTMDNEKVKINDIIDIQ